MPKYETLIITNIDAVPVGYVAMKSPRFSGAYPLVSPRTIHKALSDAHHNGEIRAAKLVRCLGDCKTGRVFVHAGDAEAYLEERYSTNVAQMVEVERKPAVVPVATVDGDVAELRSAVERLIVAIGDLTAAMQLRSEREVTQEFSDGVA